MILVTGGTGLLGLHLLIELTEKSKTPIKATYRTERKLSLSKEIFLRINPYANSLENWNKINWHKADITDIPSLEVAFKNCTLVYHCAALVSFQHNDFSKLKKVNIEGTANMVNLSLSYNIEKFCYISSIATLNLNPNETIFTEESQWNNEAQNSGYAISKHGGEMEVWRGVQEGLKAIIVNPGVILGMGIYKYGSSKIFKDVKKGLPFYTEGSTAFIGVKDCIKAILQLMNSETFNDRYILIAENKNYKSVIDHISAKINAKAPQKSISKNKLSFVSKAEHLFCSLFNKRSKIPLDLVNSLTTNAHYSNKKVKIKLNMEFEPIDSVIEEVAADFNLVHHQ